MGPVAPENPEKVRAFFYIMRQKEIFGTVQEDGTGIQYIYESDGRLINSAQIAGNVTDRKQLRLLENVEGFICRIIHGQRMTIFRDRLNSFSQRQGVLEKPVYDFIYRMDMKQQ